MWLYNLWGFFFFFGFFRATPLAYGSSLARGSNQSYSCQAIPEAQQCQIRAASATYTAAHGNAGSLTHCAGSGIETASSWMLVRFINHWAMEGTPRICVLNHILYCPLRGPVGHWGSSSLPASFDGGSGCPNERLQRMPKGWWIHGLSTWRLFHS